MILQEDVAFGGITEIRPVFVLAVGHEGVPLLVVAVVLEEFYAVEPVLHVLVLYDDECGVPYADMEGFLFGCWDEVVE